MLRYTSLINIVVFSILLAACSLPMRGLTPSRGATPEEAALQRIPQLVRPAPTQIHIRGNRQVQNEVMVLYTAGPQESPDIGVILLEQQNDSWNAVGSTYGSIVSDPGATIDYKSDPFIGRNRAWMVYGRSLIPNITTVEVTFNNGEILRDEITNRMFGIVALGATTACEIRVLDNGNKILQRVDATTTPSAPQNAKQTCQKFVQP